jgi:protein-disulfide isomerase
MSRKSQRNRPRPSEPGAEPAGSSRGLVIGVALAVVVVIIAAVVLLDDTSTPSPDASEAPAAAALASEHAPTLGNPDAKVHIVEFIDPACETCAVFYPAVKQLMAQHPDRIRLSLRHVPFHDGSEFAVRVLEASRAQDKYWQTLETLLASQSQWAPRHTVQPDLVMQAIAGVGLDLDRLRTDMDSQDVTARLRRDIADATVLKVRATPEYFVNGQPLPSFGWEPLQTLVQSELQAAY